MLDNEFHISREAKAKYSRSFQRLARLGSVGDPGVECKESQPLILDQLIPLVRVDQIARIGLSKSWGPSRQNVLQAIDQFQFAMLLT